MRARTHEDRMIPLPRLNTAFLCERARCGKTALGAREIERSLAMSTLLIGSRRLEEHRRWSQDGHKTGATLQS